MKYVRLPVLGLSIALSVGVCQAQPQTNTITTPDPFTTPYKFAVNGVSPNPTINLTAGVTNILVINTQASFHPVVITTNSADVTAWYVGATTQDISSGQISLEVPASNFPTKLYYMCYFHGFFGEIDLSAAIGPTPSPNTILHISVGTNVVMTSTGTNTTSWTVVPMYSTNIANSLWTPVPSYTNSFSNGTNTTVFSKPNVGPNVYLRISQQPPP